MLKKCIICGNEFTTKSGSAKFCSEKCRNAKITVNEHIGEVYGELEVKSVYRQNSFLYANCKCSCGKECTVKYCNLLAGHTRTCGHINRTKYDVGKTNDYGIMVLKAEKKGNKNMLHCICTCGNEFDMPADTFKIRKSCGCIHNFRYQEQTDIYNIMDNRKIQKNNKSGVRGVCWNKSTKKWNAQIVFQKQFYYLGRYSKIEDAEKARRQAEENLYENFLEWYAGKYPEQWDLLRKCKNKTIQDSLEHANTR